MLRFKRRLYLLVIILLTLMTTLNVIAITSLVRIGNEIIEISTQDIPLIKHVTKITLYQMGQAVLFEKALRFSKSSSIDGSVNEKFIIAKNKFQEFGRLVDIELSELQKTTLDTQHTTTTDHSKKKIEHITQKTLLYNDKHLEFQKHALEVMVAYQHNQAQSVTEKLKFVSENELILEQIIQGLLFKIEHFIHDSTLKAKHDEQSAIRLISIISIFSAIFGVFGSFVIAYNAVWRKELFFKKKNT